MKIAKGIYNFVMDIVLLVLAAITIWLCCSCFSYIQWDAADQLNYERYKVQRTLGSDHIEPIKETVLIIEKIKEGFEA